MNNYEVEQRIKELEFELSVLKAECVDPMLKMRIRRKEVLIDECGFKPHLLTTYFGTPMLALIRNTANISSVEMRRIADERYWELLDAMHEELLSMIAKYSNIFKDRKKQLASIKLEDLYSAACACKRAEQLGCPQHEAYARFKSAFNSLIEAGYTKEELVELIEKKI